MKNKILRTLLLSLLVIGALGVWNTSGQTFIVAASGMPASAPVQVKPIGPEPQPKQSPAPTAPVVPPAPTVPAAPVLPIQPVPPSAPMNPMMPANPSAPSQPVVPHNNVPIGPEPEPASPPLL